MALKLTQEIKSELNLNLIKKIIQNSNFQELRNKDTKIIDYKINAVKDKRIEINKTIELDLPSNITSMVSNPFEVKENWNLDKPEKILIEVEIPKVKTNIRVEIEKLDSNTLKVLSDIKSNIFMMGTFVEEHVAKFWKKLIEKDLELLNKFLSNQV